MAQQILEAQVASQNFDALALEIKHHSDFQKLYSPKYEVIGHFDYNDGIHKFLLLADCFQAGEYYKDPWGEGWVGKSFSDNNTDEVPFDTRDQAVSYLKRQYVASI